MHRTQQHICELDHCDRPAPHGTICPQCKTDTQEWLDRVGEDNLLELLLIARREAQPATRNRISHKTNTPQDALNVAVWSLWYDLAHKWPTKIQNLTKNRHAVNLIEDIQAGVHTAIRLTEGENEQAIDNAYIQKRMKQIFPLRPKDMIPYLKQHLGIQVTQRRISDWKRAGKIKPTLTNKEGWDFYHPAEILRAIDDDNRHDPKQYLYVNATT